MSEIERLQKAIALTNLAGYHLRREAFDYLNLVSATQDPTEIMKEVIQKIETLKEKPLFIDKDLLEMVMKEMRILEEKAIQSTEASCQTLSEPTAKEGNQYPDRNQVNLHQFKFLRTCTMATQGSVSLFLHRR